MHHYKDTFETWNKIASLYEDTYMDLDLYNNTYDFVSNHLNQNNASLLDIGSGPGNISKYLQHKIPNLNIQGIDIAPNMIELARKNVPTARFMVMDCREIRELSSKFDAIICGFCIPYLSKPDCINFISDCRKLLNPNGILYLSFIAGNYQDSGFKTGSTGDKIYFYYHDLKTVEHTLKANNFGVLNLIEKQFNKKDGTHETHTILIARI